MAGILRLDWVRLQNKMPGIARHDRQALDPISVGPGEGDLVEAAVAEPLGGSRHRLAAERAIKFHRRIVVR